MMLSKSASVVIDEDTIAEPEFSSPNSRKKTKALTQLERRTSFLNFEGFGVGYEDFENNLITSTKRRYSFDEMTASMMHFDRVEEEKKSATLSIRLDIKRNDVKKKKFLASEGTPKCAEDVPQIQKLMSNETINMIKNTLKSHFLFGNMDMIQMLIYLP